MEGRGPRAARPPDDPLLKKDSGVSAAELVYGAALALPVEFLSAAEPPAAEFLQKLQQVEIPATRPLSYAEVAAKPPAALLQASHVYVSRGGALPPLAPLYVGPYEVLERVDKFFRLAVGGREETVSIDHLKPHLGVGLFSAALPAANGRPRPPLPWWFSRSILRQLRQGGVLSRPIVIFNVRVCGQ